MRKWKKFLKGFGGTMLAASTGAFLASPAMAFTAPSSGGFVYDVYDILVNKMLKGPIGTAAGVAAMVYGGLNFIMGRWAGAIFPILGGAVLIKADTIAESLGMTIKSF